MKHVLKVQGNTRLFNALDYTRTGYTCVSKVICVLSLFTPETLGLQYGT